MATSNTKPNPNLSSFIWSVADLLRGDYKQSEYGKVILPFTVLRRLDCVLEPTKAAVLAEKATREKAGVNPEPFFEEAHGRPGPYWREPARVSAEQISIVHHLAAESAKFGTLTTETQRAIDLLQERRTAQISAAVTGQIDVRVVLGSL